MRTKTLILAAAALAAGIVSSQAQVYSANIVGYINVLVRPGMNMITAPLVGANNNINTVLGRTSPHVFDAESMVIKWDNGLQGYDTLPPKAGGDGNWYNNSYNDYSPLAIDPGEAFFLYSAGTTNLVLTLVGNVSMTNAVTIGANIGFYGDPVPASQDLPTNGFAISTTGSTLTWWDSTAQGWDTLPFNGVSAADSGVDQAQFYDNQWNATTPVIPNVGQGFLFNNIAPEGGDPVPFEYVRCYTNMP